MSETQAKPDRKPRRKIRRAIVDLLAAVDRTIAAAADAQKARRELESLAGTEEQTR